MNLLRLSLLFFSLNSFSGSTIFADKLDEFTDERLLNLGVFADGFNYTSPEFIGIYCSKGNAPRMFLKTGYLILNTKSNLTVQYRFDKNEPIEKEFSFESKENFLYTNDMVFIQTFLDDLRISKNLILRIEGSSEIVRFTSLTKSKTDVRRFEKAASEMVQDCDIF